MRFNQATQGTKTENLAGGEAYVQNPKLELASVLLTSFVQNEFYRSADDTIRRIKELLNQVDHKFAAKATIYARTRFGMRSISHVVAGELCQRVSGQEWLKDFLNAVVFRVDDVTEITAYYMAQGKGQKETNAMRKGLGAALSRFDAHQLSKYRAERANISLVDCVNMYHPKSTPALKKLVEGTLRSHNTWENKLTQAGQKAENQEQKEEMKAAAWFELLESRKLGYFALLRNLRNIIEQAPEAVGMACVQLTNPAAIKKSLVLPFRFQTAIEQIEQLTGSNQRQVIKALSDALEMSLSNVPVFPGRTLVAVDDSGSMRGGWYRMDNIEPKAPIKIASLFGAVLYKTNDADLLQFSDTARYQNYRVSDSVSGIADRIQKNAKAAGTDFHSIFKEAATKGEAYDRIIILSDMQGWIHGGQPGQALRAYRKALSCDPHVYSFDLKNYGSLQFPEHQVYCLAGFSEKVFDIMSMLEEDREALIHEIEKVEFKPERKH
jgi:60 kDa SS-A/Ro ribonucleoprotein